MRNIELFNDYTAEVLSTLYQNFPIKVFLDARKLSGHAEVDDFGRVIDDQGNPSRYFDTAMATIEWLSDAGIIRASERTVWGYREAVLSERGLNILRSVPAALKTKDELGARLVKFVRDGSQELARETVKALLKFAVEGLAS